MVISESMTFNQNTSDNLNPADSVIPDMEKSDEVLRTVEKSTLIYEETIGHSWIVGSATNSIVGTWTGTQDGEQLVVGGAGRVLTLSKITNPNNVFRETFKATTFKDSNLPNTASWDTTNYKLAMHSSGNHSTAYNTIANFGSIFLNSQTVYSVRITATETRYSPSDLIKYFVSADGGNNWQEITINVSTSLTITGNDLRLRVVFFGQGAKDTYIEDLNVEYGI